MKRYLLFVIAFVCVSIGAWAGPLEGFDMKKEDIGKWFVANQSDNFTPSKVIKIEVLSEDGLKNALNELNLILRGSVAKPHYAEFRAKLNESLEVNNSQGQKITFDNFIANNNFILKVVYKKEGNAPETLTLSNDDIAALNAINIPTIDLQDLKPASVFTLDNDNVKNLILPDGWTKAQVEAAASSCGNLNAALSIGTTTTDARTISGVTKDATIMAYVKKPGTLIESTIRLGYDGHLNTNVGKIGPNDFSMNKVAVAELAGHVSARDYSNGLINFDENGHFEFDSEADENSYVYNAAIGGGTRSLVGTAQYGALPAGLVVLDLGDAIIEEGHNTDLTLSMTGNLGAQTEKVVLPTYPGLKTIPADCLNASTKVRDICIPGNIEYIKTRAFNGNAGDGRLAYVWTTGTDTDVRYDNGAVFEENGDFICHNEEGYVRNGCLYGTFTLPPNLKLIERFAFGSSINVKDVYVLNPIAPECHVDAFSSDMYVGNNTYDASSIDDGIITRDAYIQGDASNHRFITMLHYPREAGTPNSQRFTDPSREYSVATGERDGNGNMIYFPNQSEFSYAYLQGSYGYVWKGWNDARNWYDNELSLGYGSEFALDKPAHSALAANGQTLANDLWTNNTSIMLTDGHLEKYDRTFYDLTLGENNQPDEVSAPATDPTELKPYYEVYRREHQLYPQAKYEESYYVYVRDEDGDYVKDPSVTCNTVFRDYAGSADDQLERYSRKQVPQTDGQGNIIYEGCTDGKYVKDYEFVLDETGDFVKEKVQSGYSITQTLVDGVDTYYSDEEGTAVTPQVGEGMYVECGTDDDYSPIDPNNEQPGDREVYYTLSDGVYTPTTSLPLSGNPHLYVKTNRMQPKYSSTALYGNVNQNALKFGVAHYFSDPQGQNEVIPVITSLPQNGTLYYKDAEGVYHQTSTFIQGQGDYYIEFSHAVGTYTAINDSYPQVSLDGVYYYADGQEPVYEDAQNFTPGTTYYINNNGYYEQTIEWYMIAGGGGNLYYVSGSHTAYCSAEDVDYDANKTYYSDQNGTVATTITLNGDYYIPTYVDVYREKTDGDVAPFYRKDYLNTYHLATAADAGETDRYCIATEDYQASTPINYSISHDYRGWHQFVLTAVAHNSTEEFEPLRSFITDNDWWTICAPYDLRYNDMKKFFGTDRQGLGQNIPYLSKLMYVIRDVEHQTITLMFSKNLMEYKEQRLAKDTQDGFATGSRVHGYIDDETLWTPEELEANPVILHAGVPYLIRPNLTIDAQTGNIDAVRQFDIYREQNAELYERLQQAQDMTGSYQKQLVYNGMYTVPAYVVGTNPNVTENTTDSRTFEMKDGSKFTYTSTNKTIKYHGKDVPYSISTDFAYTFVGTFYKSVMPQYCYFLGWDSNKNCAAFWYSRVQDTSGWNWNNETGVICPNFNTDLEIHGATSLKDPARWILAAQNVENDQTNIKCDDFTVGAAASNAKQYTMDYGASMNLASVDEDPLAEDFGNQEVLSIDEIQSLDVKGEWYNVNGQKLNGRPTQSGVYIMGNKKYVVK